MDQPLVERTQVLLQQSPEDWSIAERMEAGQLLRAFSTELDRIDRLLNTPETMNFVKGVELEIPHQQNRWGADHDADKTPFGWFWLIGYLAQKAATAQRDGDFDKARHHTISTAAVLGNWHSHIDEAGAHGQDRGWLKAQAATLRQLLESSESELNRLNIARRLRSVEEELGITEGPK